MKQIPFILLTLLSSSFQWLQAQTQTVRGTVVDRVAQAPLAGVTIVVVNSQPLVGTTTDEQGQFRLDHIKTGKITLKFSYIGYKDYVLPDLLLTAGKEAVLQIQMDESIVESSEIVVKAKEDKGKPLNDMSVVSSRTFSVEETQRYAAAVNDPLRMATSFAGVSPGMDGNNMITVRGNAPGALLWRMEGVDIPNPNHFSAVGTSGGGISILSSQLLSNSDFSTGAFAAEYGNALGGVFDLRLRKGNNQKREHTFRAGFMGLDFATEGPFKKGYAGSYLVNYRYSTLGIISKLGVDIGDASTNFQDLSFNVFLPTKKYGSFGVFGFGGLSTQTTKYNPDSSLWGDAFFKMNSRYSANTGAIGLTHQYHFNDKSYLRTAFVFSGTGNGFDAEEIDPVTNTFFDRYKEEFIQNKVTLSSTYNLKINSRQSLRAGVIINRLGYGLYQSYRNDSTSRMIVPIDQNGNTLTFQAFSQWKYRVNTRLTIQAGLHYLELLLNHSRSLEPRASLKYDINARQSLSFGYGLHSQVLPLGTYFVQINENGQTRKPNSSLALPQSHHYVLGYDYAISAGWRLKMETYYQDQRKMAIGDAENGTFALANKVDGFVDFALFSTGRGKNYGAELTLEKFLSNNSYLLLSGSVYESRYQGRNGQWYNTRFNGNYNVTLTAGKEITLSEKRKSRVIGFNAKLIHTGGLRNTPINREESIAQNEVVWDFNRAFNRQNPYYLRLDIGLSVKRNYTRVTGTWTLDIQNVTNRKNVGGEFFDTRTQQVNFWYQAPLIPILSYKVEF